MLSRALRRIIELHLLTAILVGTVAAYAADADMRLTGLALHQETGRNIYLGGIYFDQQVPRPDDLVGASGPKLMEYRVIARRTSIRSLLGGMLLQGELASGQTPDASVTQFAKDILSSVQGSLYAGDNFSILLTENDETVAMLNGQELARIDDGNVSDYILSGWVGDQGPSTAFRASITAASVDATLMETFEQTAFTQDRADQVASWVGEPAAEAPTDTSTDTEQPAATQEQIAAIAAPTAASVQEVIEEAPTGAPTPAIAAASAATVAVATSTTQPEINKTSPIPSSATVGETASEPTSPASAPGTTLLQSDSTQVASLLPGAGLPEDPTSDIVGALDVKDYSQRLAAFNNGVLKKVYGEIRYPTRAVRRGLQGRVELDVTLLESGELVDITVVQSSGYKILDKAAVSAAGKALDSITSEELDPVAVAEFGGADNRLIVPVPVQFMLTE